MFSKSVRNWPGKTRSEPRTAWAGDWLSSHGVEQRPSRTQGRWAAHVSVTQRLDLEAGRGENALVEVDGQPVRCEDGEDLLQ